ncbi:PREDICTED: tyrosine-protein kinase BAZ1B-like, partial [Leptosomus discolor]|uniref:tyrosine-protein kinase BAZ1B-like n=1 Tax=Leptosomus discolor TaxID=188344 RepID=UPI0005226A61
VLQTKKTARRQNLELQKCEEILSKLIKYRFSWPFREPVTTEEAEDYFEVISHPMDFQTMQSKCSCGDYRSVQEFLSDIKQVFSNAERYNQNGSHVLSCLEKTEQCLIDMVHKHLPGHTYARRKRKKLSARCQGLEEQEGDSESEPLEHSRGRKRKK